jgi:UDP-N-acetylmuramate dehydrogenase
MAVGEVRRAEPLSRHTTLHIGGPADLMVWPDSARGAGAVVALCADRGVPVLPLGRGSNLLVPDAGYRGVVLSTSRMAELVIDGGHVRAGAGLTLGGLGVRTVRAGLAGLEFATGIPGSVGGGLVMNAGAHGGELAPHVEAVWAVGPGDAVPRRLDRAQCGFSYRHSVFQEGGVLVLEGEFRLEPGSRERGEALIRRFRDERRERQPQRWPNCGSVFKNPPGDHAGRLVERVGGKGRRCGAAQISEVHGNFIVNLGGATYADVLCLIHWAREAVRAQCGIDLELEVRVLAPPI